MGKLIQFPNIPHLDEERCKTILANVACMTEPLASHIVMNLEYKGYCAQRTLYGMSAKGLQKLGFPIEFEVNYLEERLESATGGQDE